MHNTLTTLSLIALIGAGVLSFMNKGKLAEANSDNEQAQVALTKAKKDLENRETEANDLEGDLASATEERAKFEKEESELSGQVDAKDSELEEVEDALRTANDELARLKDEADNRGRLEELAEQLKTLRSDNAELDRQLAALTSQSSSLSNTSASLQSEIDGIRKEVEDQDKGIVPESFSTRISQVFPDWGFVVINAGNQQKSAEGATLSVKRGGVEIGKLKVTELFQNRSVADIVRGSVSGGVTIQPGDTVEPSGE